MTIEGQLLRAKTDYDEVYEAGYVKGKSEGGNTEGAYNEGFEAGKEAEYDAFWNVYQRNGQRTNHVYAFAGSGWNYKNFKPKYDIIVKGTARGMFASAEYMSKVDVAEVMDALGLKFDTSGVTSIDGFDNFCHYSSPKGLPVIDVTGVNTVRNVFMYAANLVTIRALKLRDDGTQTFNGVFKGCTALVEIRIEGVIGQNGFDVSDCTKLSKASHESIVTHLSTTTSGMSAKFSQTAINKAFETSTGANDGYTNQSSGWHTLITRWSNWTFEYGI